MHIATPSFNNGRCRSVAHTKADPEAAYDRPREFGEGFSAKLHAEFFKAGRQPPLLKPGVAICIKAENMCIWHTKIW